MGWICSECGVHNESSKPMDNAICWCCKKPYSKENLK